MTVSPVLLRYQGPTLRALGRVALGSIRGPSVSALPAIPGPWLEEEVQPRPKRLIDAYVDWSEGNPGDYQDQLPPHLFPQWGFALIGRTLANIPYKMTAVLNQGCRIVVNQPLPRDQPLQLKARLEAIEDDGYKARIHQRLITGTRDAPEALIADLFAVVVLKKKESLKHRSADDEVPLEQIGSWQAGANAGRDFALLTGDFNPIHWIAPYAKMAGFKNKILHGFGSLARSFEILQAQNGPIAQIDVRFVRPLVLPASTTVWLGSAIGDGMREVQLRDSKDNICMAGRVTFG